MAALRTILPGLALAVIFLFRETAWFIWAGTGFALLSALTLWICSRIAERKAKKQFGL